MCVPAGFSFDCFFWTEATVPAPSGYECYRASAGCCRELRRRGRLGPNLLHNKILRLELPDHHGDLVPFFYVSPRICEHDEIIPVGLRRPGSTERSHLRRL